MEKRGFPIGLHQERFSWLKPEGAGRPHGLGRVNFCGISTATTVLPKDGRKTSLTLFWFGLFFFFSVVGWVFLVLPPPSAARPDP